MPRPSSRWKMAAARSAARLALSYRGQASSLDSLRRCSDVCRGLGAVSYLRLRSTISHAGMRTGPVLLAMAIAWSAMGQEKRPAFEAAPVKRSARAGFPDAKPRRSGGRSDHDVISTRRQPPDAGWMGGIRPAARLRSRGWVHGTESGQAKARNYEVIDIVEL